jgi:hypothetical protein
MLQLSHQVVDRRISQNAVAAGRVVLCDLSAARIHQRCKRAGRFAERVGVLGFRSIV